jgi:single-stranded-DNA-specific exonuclease
MVSPAKIIQADVLGTNHLRLIVTDASFGGRGQSTRLKVMGFGMAETPLGQALLNHRTQPVELIGRLKQESWQGRESVSLMLDDARFYA